MFKLFEWANWLTTGCWTTSSRNSQWGKSSRNRI